MYVISIKLFYFFVSTNLSFLPCIRKVVTHNHPMSPFLHLPLKTVISPVFSLPCHLLGVYEVDSLCGFGGVLLGNRLLFPCNHLAGNLEQSP